MPSQKSQIEIQPHEKILVSGSKKAVEDISLLYDQIHTSDQKAEQSVVQLSYPEGGLRAWLVVCGSFCGILASFGFMNSRKFLNMLHPQSLQCINILTCCSCNIPRIS
jgi:hypothetical protein